MIPYFYWPEIYIGSLAISTYHLMHSLSYLAAGIFILLEAQRRKLDLDKIFQVALWGFVGAIIGARLGGVLRNLSSFISHPEYILNFSVGGWTESGGFILSFILMFFAIRRLGLSQWEVLDTIAPALSLRFAVSRFGCVAVHDHIGKLMQYPWPWGVIRNGEVRHETGLYSLVANLVIFGILWFFRKRFQIKGALFVMYLFLYSISVFLIRFFRAADLPYVSDERYWGLTSTQYIVIIVFVTAIFLWFKLKQKNA